MKSKDKNKAVKKTEGDDWVRQATSEIIYNSLKAHLVHEPDWKIVKMAKIMQNQKSPASDAAAIKAKSTEHEKTKEGEEQWKR